MTFTPGVAGQACRRGGCESRSDNPASRYGRILYGARLRQRTGQQAVNPAVQPVTGHPRAAAFGNGGIQCRAGDRIDQPVQQLTSPGASVAIVQRDAVNAEGGQRVSVPYQTLRPLPG